jgi:5-formyltetrahydrofolate cyclo-ligase
MTTMDSKSLMRARMRSARNALTPGYRRLANVDIVAILKTELLARSASTIGAYLAYGGEADPLPCRSGWVAQGFRFPRVGPGGLLTFHEVDHEDELVAGYRGILEPTPHAPEVSLGSLDAILVPGLAFERRGVRLGQGGGFYDRVLARDDCPFSIGIAFAAQIVPSIPQAAHDQQVSCVVTEGGITQGDGWNSRSQL